MSHHQTRVEDSDAAQTNSCRHNFATEQSEEDRELLPSSTIDPRKFFAPSSRLMNFVTSIRCSEKSSSAWFRNLPQQYKVHMIKEAVSRIELVIVAKVSR